MVRLATRVFTMEGQVVEQESMDTAMTQSLLGFIDEEYVMSTLQSFSGFPPAGMQFLRDLAENNNRAWFQAHKKDYLTHLLGPAQAFVVALGERLKALSPHIIYDVRADGRGSLMRIHRDTRFSKDETPYKTNVSMVFWEGRGKKTENPGFFVRLEPTRAGIFAGQHAFPKPVLAAYRDAVIDDTMGAELEETLSTVRASGVFQIGGEHYKRVPPGYDPDHTRADLLRYNGLYAFSPPISAEQFASAEMVDVCFEHCQKMAPLHYWLVKLARRAAD
jgi:uncharacterized protein (TIGR02453 family)